MVFVVAGEMNHEIAKNAKMNKERSSKYWNSKHMLNECVVLNMALLFENVLPPLSVKLHL